MKKIFFVFIACIALLCLTACNSSTLEEEATTQSSVEQTDNTAEDLQQSGEQGETKTGSDQVETDGLGTNSLVVYFSATGNTRLAAETLAEIQGADLYEIVPEQPYTDKDLNYNDSSGRATVEQNDETSRPEINGKIDNIENYNVIYVGFPIWWGDMPHILYTFFDTYDLSGKTIAPFCTSGGSGISGAVNTIEALEPSAELTDGLRMSNSNVTDDLTEWLSNIGLAE